MTAAGVIERDSDVARRGGVPAEVDLGLSLRHLFAITEEEPAGCHKQGSAMFEDRYGSGRPDLGQVSVRTPGEIVAIDSVTGEADRLHTRQ